MRLLTSWLPLRRLSTFTNVKEPRSTSIKQGYNPYHSTPARDLNVAATSHVLPVSEEFLPELPPVPRYPCPFISETDVTKYLVPLYRAGWGISPVPANTSESVAKTVPPATQLSRSILFPNPDITRIFMRDVATTIIEQENHHPTWEQPQEAAFLSTRIHVYTHAAFAPPDRQNADDQQVFARRRPGITHRDIRFAIFFERLLRDYVHGRFLESQHSVSFEQPVNIDIVHNFRVLS